MDEKVVLDFINNFKAGQIWSSSTQADTGE
jgi:hypothetical protein